MKNARALLLLASTAALAAWACEGNHSRSAATPGAAATEAEDDDAEEEEEEEPASLAVLPPAARAVVLRLAGSSAIEEVETHSRGGVTTYEAEFRTGGQEQSVLVSASGELLEVRKVVPAAGLPAEVRAAVQRALPGGVIEEAEAVHAAGADAPARYDIEVTRGRRTRRLTVSSSPP